MGENCLYRGLSILGLGHYRQAIEEPQQSADPAPHQRLIVNNADPDQDQRPAAGMAPRMLNPWPDPLATEMIAVPAPLLIGCTLF